MESLDSGSNQIVSYEEHNETIKSKKSSSRLNCSTMVSYPTV